MAVSFFGKPEDNSAQMKLEMTLASLIDSQQQMQRVLSEMLKELVNISVQTEKIASELHELKQQAPAKAPEPAAASPSYPTSNDAQRGYGSYGGGYDTFQTHSYTPPTGGYNGKDIAQQPDTKPLTQSAQVFYANIEGDYLTECPDRYKQTAMVIVTANGDSARVDFNPLCAETYASSFDTNLMPYFDTDLQSTNPTSVEALNSTTASKVGSYWKLNGRIKLRLY